VVLERRNGAFRSIGAVIVWWDKLDLDVVAAYKCSDSGRAFVVHHVEVDGNIVVLECVNDALESGGHCRIVFFRHWSGKNGIDIVDVRDEYVRIVAEGPYGEGAG